MLLKLKDVDAFSKRTMISPSYWWWIIDQSNEKLDKKLPQDFCKFFSKLKTCPASSGSIERNILIIWTCPV